MPFCRSKAARARKNNVRHRVDDSEDGDDNTSTDGLLRRTKDDWKHELEQNGGSAAEPGSPGLGLFVSAIKTPALGPQQNPKQEDEELDGFVM